MPSTLDRIIRAASMVPWAIQPRKLLQIAEVLALRAEGGRLSPDEVAARIGERDSRAAVGKVVAQSTEVVGRAPGVAVLPLIGVMSQRLDMLDEISGGASVERFGQRFDEMMENGDIGTIILQIDSPGGSVFGVDELSQKIFEARGSDGKRIVAIADSLMASAAYYVGSAAHELIVTPGGVVGSIGVFALHTEFARAFENAGISNTLIRAGRFKAETNPFEPLTDDARAHLEEEVNDYLGLFHAAVARNRGVDRQTVAAEFGEGRVFTAQRAVDAGLADRVASFDDLLAELGVSRSRRTSSRAAAPRTAPAAQTTNPTEPAATDVAGTGEGIAAEAEGATPAETTQTPDMAAAEAPKETEMPHSDTAAHGAAATTPAPSASVGADALEGERKRASEIIQLAHAHGMAERAVGWISEGLSADQVGRRILGLKGEEEPITPEQKPLLDLSPADQNRYSFVRAIRAAADQDWSRAGFEREISNEIAKAHKTEPKGFFAPTHLGPLPRKFAGVDDEIARRAHGGPRAALDTGTAGAGAELVFVEPGSFIDMLRTRMVTTALGATFLPGLNGDVSFPKQTGANTLTWHAENPGADVGLTDLATGQVTLSPRNAMANQAFSRTLLAQGVINVEQLVRRDLTAVAARGLDFAALHGGGGDTPTGIYAASGVNAVPFGGSVTWPLIVEMETEIVADDADIGVMAYATTPEARGSAKTTEKATNTGQFLWTGGVEDGEMNGFRAMASNQFLKNLGVGTNEHGLVFGVWDQLLIGEWGAMDVLVDPYSLGGQALIIVRLFLMADVALRHAEAFTKATGLVPA